MAVNSGHSTLKKKHKPRWVERKLDNQFESTVITGFSNFHVQILVTCTFLSTIVNAIYRWKGKTSWGVW